MTHHVLIVIGRRVDIKKKQFFFFVELFLFYSLFFHFQFPPPYHQFYPPTNHTPHTFTFFFSYPHSPLHTHHQHCSPPPPIFPFLPHLSPHILFPLHPLFFFPHSVFILSAFSFTLPLLITNFFLPSA